MSGTETAEEIAIRFEQDLIGRLLVTQGGIDDAVLRVGANDFYAPDMRAVFEVLCEISQEGMEINGASVYERLQRSKSRANGWSLVELAELANSAIPGGVSHIAGRVADYALRRRIKAAVLSVTADLGSQESAHEALAMAISRLEATGEGGRAVGLPKSVREVAADCIGTMQERYNAGNKTAGFSCGFPDLDSKLGGLHGGTLIVVGGRPGMGKSTLAVNIAEHVAADTGPVLIVSLEMSGQQIVFRVMSGMSGLGLQRLLNADMDQRDSEDTDPWSSLNTAVAKCHSLPLYLEEKSDTPSILAATARRMHRTIGLKMLVVDYLGLMRADRNYERKDLEVSEITRSLKRLSMELNIPILALSQLSRKVEERQNKRPLLSDLRDSGSIEQDADAVIFLYRPQYYLDNEADGDIGEIIVAKNRMGPVGTTYGRFDGAHTRYLPLTHEELRMHREEQDSRQDHSPRQQTRVKPFCPSYKAQS